MPNDLTIFSPEQYMESPEWQEADDEQREKFVQEYYSQGVSRLAGMGLLKGSERAAWNAASSKFGYNVEGFGRRIVSDLGRAWNQFQDMAASLDAASKVKAAERPLRELAAYENALADDPNVSVEEFDRRFAAIKGARDNAEAAVREGNQELAKTFAKNFADQSAFPRSAVFNEFMETDDLLGFMFTPSKVIPLAAHATIENLPNMVSTIGANAFAGPVGAGLVGGALEFSAMLPEMAGEELNRLQLDPSKPENWEKILNEPGFLEKARAAGAAKGIVIGAVDAALGGLATAVGKKTAAKLTAEGSKLRQVGAAATGAAMQATAEVPAESAGEYLGTLAAGREPDARDVILEGLAAGPASVARFAVETAKASRDILKGIDPNAAAAAAAAGKNAAAAVSGSAPAPGAPAPAAGAPAAGAPAAAAPAAAPPTTPTPQSKPVPVKVGTKVHTPNMTIEEVVSIDPATNEATLSDGSKHPVGSLVAVSLRSGSQPVPPAAATPPPQQAPAGKKKGGKKKAPAAAAPAAAAPAPTPAAAAPAPAAGGTPAGTPPETPTPSTPGASVTETPARQPGAPVEEKPPKKADTTKESALSWINRYEEQGAIPPSVATAFRTRIESGELDPKSALQTVIKVVAASEKKRKPGQAPEQKPPETPAGETPTEAPTEAPTETPTETPAAEMSSEESSNLIEQLRQTKVARDKLYDAITEATFASKEESDLLLRDAELEKKEKELTDRLTAAGVEIPPLTRDERSLAAEKKKNAEYEARQEEKRRQDAAREEARKQSSRKPAPKPVGTEATAVAVEEKIQSLLNDKVINEKLADGWRTRAAKKGADLEQILRRLNDITPRTSEPAAASEAPASVSRNTLVDDDGADLWLAPSADRNAQRIQWNESTTTVEETKDSKGAKMQRGAQRYRTVSKPGSKFEIEDTATGEKFYVQKRDPQGNFVPVMTPPGGVKSGVAVSIPGIAASGDLIQQQALAAVQEFMAANPGKYASLPIDRVRQAIGRAEGQIRSKGKANVAGIFASLTRKSRVADNMIGQAIQSEKRAAKRKAEKGPKGVSEATPEDVEAIKEDNLGTDKDDGINTTTDQEDWNELNEKPRTTNVDNVPNPVSQTSVFAPMEKQSRADKEQIVREVHEMLSDRFPWASPSVIGAIWEIMKSASQVAAEIREATAAGNRELVKERMKTLRILATSVSSVSKFRDTVLKLTGIDLANEDISQRDKNLLIGAILGGSDAGSVESMLRILSPITTNSEEVGRKMRHNVLRIMELTGRKLPKYLQDALDKALAGNLTALELTQAYLRSLRDSGAKGTIRERILSRMLRFGQIRDVLENVVVSSSWSDVTNLYAMPSAASAVLLGNRSVISELGAIAIHPVKFFSTILSQEFAKFTSDMERMSDRQASGQLDYTSEEALREMARLQALEKSFGAIGLSSLNDTAVAEEVLHSLTAAIIGEDEGAWNALEEIGRFAIEYLIERGNVSREAVSLVMQAIDRGKAQSGDGRWFTLSKLMHSESSMSLEEQRALAEMIHGVSRAMNIDRESARELLYALGSPTELAAHSLFNPTVIDVLTEMPGEPGESDISSLGTMFTRIWNTVMDAFARLLGFATPEDRMQFEDTLYADVMQLLNDHVFDAVDGLTLKERIMFSIDQFQDWTLQKINSEINSLRQLDADLRGTSMALENPRLLRDVLPSFTNFRQMSRSDATDLKDTLDGLWGELPEREAALFDLINSGKATIGDLIQYFQQTPPEMLNESLAALLPGRQPLMYSILDSIDVLQDRMRNDEKSILNVSVGFTEPGNGAAGLFVSKGGSYFSSKFGRETEDQAFMLLVPSFLWKGNEQAMIERASEDSEDAADAAAAHALAASLSELATGSDSPIGHDTVLHEIAHAITEPMLAKSEGVYEMISNTRDAVRDAMVDPNVPFGGGNYQIWRTVISEFPSQEGLARISFDQIHGEGAFDAEVASESPDIDMIASAIETRWMDAEQAKYVARMVVGARKTFNRIAELAELESLPITEDEATSIVRSMLYALSDPSEFFVAALTDPIFQKILSKIKVGKYANDMGRGNALRTMLAALLRVMRKAFPNLKKSTALNRVVSLYETAIRTTPIPEMVGMRNFEQLVAHMDERFRRKAMMAFDDVVVRMMAKTPAPGPATKRTRANAVRRMEQVSRAIAAHWSSSPQAAELRRDRRARELWDSIGDRLAKTDWTQFTDQELAKFVRITKNWIKSKGDIRFVGEMSREVEATRLRRIVDKHDWNLINTTIPAFFRGALGEVRDFDSVMRVMSPTWAAEKDLLRVMAPWRIRAKNNELKERRRLFDRVTEIMREANVLGPLETISASPDRMRRVSLGSIIVQWTKVSSEAAGDQMLKNIQKLRQSYSMAASALIDQARRDTQRSSRKERANDARMMDELVKIIDEIIPKVAHIAGEKDGKKAKAAVEAALGMSPEDVRMLNRLRFVFSSIGSRLEAIARGVYGTDFTKFENYLPLEAVTLQPDPNLNYEATLGSMASFFYTNGFRNQSGSQKQRWGISPERQYYNPNFIQALERSLHRSLNDIHTAQERMIIEQLIASGAGFAAGEDSRFHEYLSQLQAYEAAEGFDIEKGNAMFMLSRMGSAAVLSSFKQFFQVIPALFDFATHNSVLLMSNPTMAGYVSDLWISAGVDKVWSRDKRAGTKFESALDPDIRAFLDQYGSKIRERAGGTVSTSLATKHLMGGGSAATLSQQKIQNIRRAADTIVEGGTKVGTIALHTNDAVSSESLLLSEVVCELMRSHGVTNPSQIDWKNIPLEVVAIAQARVDQNINTSLVSEKGRLLRAAGGKEGLARRTFWFLGSHAARMGARSVDAVRMMRSSDPETRLEGAKSFMGVTAQAASWAGVGYLWASGLEMIASGIRQRLAGEEDDPDDEEKMLERDQKEVANATNWRRGAERLTRELMTSYLPGFSATAPVLQHVGDALFNLLPNSKKRTMMSIEADLSNMRELAKEQGINPQDLPGWKDYQELKKELQAVKGFKIATYQGDFATLGGSGVLIGEAMALAETGAKVATEPGKKENWIDGAMTVMLFSGLVPGGSDLLSVHRKVRKAQE